MDFVVAVAAQNLSVLCISLCRASPLDISQHCRLAAEVERLQPFAEKVADLEARIESHPQELAGAMEDHESQEASPSS